VSRDLLLDTQVFLWWDLGAERLGETARRLIAETENRIHVSAASIWEIAIKRRLGKLAFSGSAVDAVRASSFLELAISGADCEAAGALEWVHADPFDRLIVAQAQRRDMTLITADRLILALPDLGAISAA
jgi:PIN domain nuclease of toxin-antitoxin system